MTFISIDPGKKGALVVWENGMPVEGLRFKGSEHGIELAKINECLKKFKPEIAFLEKIIPGQRKGKRSAAVQFTIIGQLIALIELNQIELKLVAPMTWASYLKKRLGFHKSTKAKDASLELCLKFYADFVKSTMTKREKVFPDGVTDAVAIGHYSYYQLFQT